MNTLYNKILNEVYLVQDFDSWDDTESDFKATIKNSISLSNPIFTYRNTPFFKNWEKPEPLRIFGPYWLDLVEGKTVVYIDGIQTAIRYTGRSPLAKGNTFKKFKVNKNYDVVIKYITDYTNCSRMFQYTHLIGEVPLWDTSNITSMQGMFLNTWITKAPEFNVRKVENLSEMFNNCYELETVPLFKNLNLDLPLRNCWAMFHNCNSLDDDTIMHWSVDDRGNSKIFNNLK